MKNPTFACLATAGLAFGVHAQQLESTGPADAPAAAVSGDLFARDSYRIDPVICPFKGEIDYEPGEIECGLLQVPENREDPQSRFIELHFVKLNSRWGREGFAEERAERDDPHAAGLADGKRDDPVIYLTGGPGALVTYYVGRFKDHTLLDHRDLYILEQRGIGYSSNFCRFYDLRDPAADNVSDFEAYGAAGNQEAENCARAAAAAGVDLSGYNTLENARDVKALRRALGYENWNVWGISYGSILGQAYLKEDPEGIRAAALDAIMPLAIAGSDEYWRVAKWYVRDLAKLQAICDAQPACAERYPDLLGRVRAAIAAVRDEPIAVPARDLEVYPSGTGYLFQDVAGYLPFMLFYEQDNYPGLPGVIYAWADAVERRDQRVFKTLIGAVALSGIEESGAGMRNAILCLDGDLESMARAGALDAAEFPLIGTAIQSLEAQQRAAALCGTVGMAPRPRSDYEPTRTDIPTLIIEGDMDPITPPPNAQAILPGFSNGTYVEFPYAGHGPSRSVSCAGHLLNKFYDDPRAEPDLGCVEDMEPPEIWAPMYTHDVVGRLGALYFEDKKKIALPAIWLGLSTIILLVAFLVLTFAPLLRFLERRSAAAAGTARLFAWLASVAAVVTLVAFGAAAYVTREASQMLLAFGLVPWARWVAWLGVLAGLLGIVTVVTTLRGGREGRPPLGSALGFVLTGLAALALSSFLWVFGLGPI